MFSTVAFEDASVAHVASAITDMLQQSIDELDEYFDELLSSDNSSVSATENLDRHHDDYENSRAKVDRETDSTDEADDDTVNDCIGDDVYVSTTPPTNNNAESAHGINSQSSPLSEIVRTQNDGFSNTQPVLVCVSRCIGQTTTLTILALLLTLPTTVTMLKSMITRS